MDELNLSNIQSALKRHQDRASSKKHVFRQKNYSMIELKPKMELKKSNERKLIHVGSTHMLNDMVDEVRKRYDQSTYSNHFVSAAKLPNIYGNSLSPMSKAQQDEISISSSRCQTRIVTVRDHNEIKKMERFSKS